MISLNDTIFMIKHANNTIFEQYARVKLETIINDTCLVEDINNKKRQWVMKYELYPINNVYYSGWWAQSNYYDNICKSLGYIY